MSQASFGQVLKYRRKVRDLTQSALAERIGYSLSTLRKLESGTLRPSRGLVRRFADVLQLSDADHARFLDLARMPPPIASLSSESCLRRSCVYFKPRSTIIFIATSY